MNLGSMGGGKGEDKALFLNYTKENNEGRAGVNVQSSWRGRRASLLPEALPEGARGGVGGHWGGRDSVRKKPGQRSIFVNLGVICVISKEKNIGLFWWGRGGGPSPSPRVQGVQEHKLTVLC